MLLLSYTPSLRLAMKSAGLNHPVQFSFSTLLGEKPHVVSSLFSSLQKAEDGLSKLVWIGTDQSAFHFRIFDEDECLKRNRWGIMG